MAKTTSRPAADIASLLTSAEKKVLDGTLGTSLAAATQVQLQAARKQARALRDKWQDLYQRQTIATKRMPSRTRGTTNTRSKEKADLFGEALARVKARLAELIEGASAAVGGTKARRSSASRSVTKSARQAGHRSDRATIHKELSQAAAAINKATRKRVRLSTAAKKPARPKPAAKPKAPIASDKVAVQAGPRGKKASRKPATSKKARQAGKREALTASGVGQAIVFDVKKQRSANTKAIAARFKLDGQTTRRKGVAVASTKRKQARRDSR